MGNIIRCLTGRDHGHGDDDDYYPYYRAASTASRPRYELQAGGWEDDDEPAAAFWPRQQSLGPIHGGVSVTPAATAASLAQDLQLNMESTSMIPEGFKRHVTSSKKAQTNWYKDMAEAYKDMKTPQKTQADLEDIFSFHNLPTASLPLPDSNHHRTPPPEDVQFVLNTLPVHNKCIGDGDGFTAYVDTADPTESADVPREVHEMVIAITQARTDRDYQTANALQRSLDKAGYKVIDILGEEILARKYRIRMRGIDAPELKMPYGMEAKKELIKLIGGKSVTIYVYEQDQFGRYVGDIYCDNMFIQEQMLKCGHVHHFKKYDKRPEFENWQKEAKSTGLGLWASKKPPQKPWDWRRNKRHARHSAIPVY
ncbi:probable staphylococcal-like nuclease CAN2 isoform X2 [Sorghum bicolor]|uniref:probable staphylococcal-like nuclease CAN2 isoform X2 n=1 Tax=Sorghum bicolor TaxID=4558 RepID=UPI000B425EBB|nr:probable staphylococcal-like nuclease CAN2 isoform X2 [Sorghum bicolor]|eukprot:XP_021301372.1 probable staphylococcal-like nuclease CAN2 isoform X2 [Sorghum bicolor]